MVKLGDGGSADIDIDSVSGMTPGTFESLCCTVRRSTTNESGFVPVRSSFSGSVLTITASEGTCRDDVFWQVIGERCDPTIKASVITDADGFLITEPNIT